MKTNLVMPALALVLLLANFNQSAADEATKPNDHNNAVHDIHAPPPKHPLFSCTKGTCTCANMKDCGDMGTAHVCKEGTFKDNACTEKPY